MGLDTIIVIVLVGGAVGFLVYLQRASAKKNTKPPETTGK